MKVRPNLSDEYVPVKIYLNADLCDEVRSLSCDALQPDALVSIPNILEAAVKSFDLLPLHNFRADKAKPLKGPVAAKATHPNPLLPTAVTTYTNEHAMEVILRVDNHIKHFQRQLSAAASSEEEDEGPIDDAFELVEDFEQLCGICFADVDVSQTGETSPMALAQCQHWFCQDCWTIHISTAIQNGQIPVRCPEYDCKAMLDLDTLRSVVALPLCWMYAAQLRDTFIQKHGKEWKWCPNKHCGRVVHVQEGDLEPAPILACYCGHTWCPECTELPHWPASCQQSAEYINRLTKDGHLSVEPTTHVAVKECPFCHLKMQRSEGCNYMSCRCGKAFCWACAKPFTSNEYSHTNCQSQLSNRKSFQHVKLIDVVKGGYANMRDTWYLPCVAHRIARYPAKKRHLLKLLDSQISSNKQCCLLLGESTRLEAGFKRPSIKQGRMNQFHAIKKQVWTSLNQAHQFAENSLVWFYNSPGLNKTQKRSFMSCIDRLNLLIQIVEQDITNKKLDRLIANLNGLEARTMDLINIVKGFKRVVVERQLGTENDEAEDGVLNSSVSN